MTTMKWELQEGDEIVPGRYALRLLGGGHRYEAYLAWDEEMQYIVVAKMLRPDLVTSRSGLRGLRAEADVLENLAHPVLLRSFGVVDDGPRPHLVLEHLEGPRLSSLLRRHGRLGLDQALPLGMQLSSALHYMHRKEMVHLDVKPQNIIMGGPPRLIDLSVARTFDQATTATEPIGTDAYMAPEQAEPQHFEGGMGPRSDVWGWGVTMYEALSGVLPFPRIDDEGDGRFPQLHLDPLPITGDIPVVLGDLVMSTLERQPENRPTQLEVSEALEPMAAALPRRIVLSRLRPRVS